MCEVESKPEAHSFVLHGVSPEAQLQIGDLATQFGVQLTPLEEDVEASRRIKVVNQADLITFATELADGNEPRAIRNCVTARTIWTRAQHLVAAKKAHAFGRELPVLTRQVSEPSWQMQRHTLPPNTKLEFSEVPILITPETMTALDWITWSQDLDSLKLASMREVKRRLSRTSTKREQVLGAGIGPARVNFFENFVEHASS